MDDKPQFHWRWNHTLMALSCVPIWAVAWHYVGGLIYYWLFVK